MKWTRKNKDEIIERFQYWMQVFAILPCTVAYDFQTEDQDDIAATIKSMYPYRKFEVEIFPSFLTLDHGMRRDMLIIHELLHYIISPITSNRLAVPDHFRCMEEQVVDKLAHVIAYEFTPNITQS